MENRFIRVRSVKDSVIAISLIVVGIILMSLSLGTNVNLASFILIVLGAFLFFVLKSGYMDTETGEKCFKKEHYFAPNAKAMLTLAVASNPEGIDLSKAGEGNSLKLDIYYNPASGKAYLYLYEYVPHHYVLCGQMREYEMGRVVQLL